MKRILTLLIFISSSSYLLQAQNVPQAINYQGIAVDVVTGIPVTNSSITIEISLLEASPTGAISYKETHTVMTGATGVFNLKIGRGTTTTGAFNQIDWLSDTHYIKLAADLTGGSSLVPYGNAELLSVPYSLVAREAAAIRGFPLTGTPNTDQFLAWDGTTWTPTDIPDSDLVVAGDGVNVSKVGNEATVSATLGTEITSNEILDGTIQAEDIAEGVILTDYLSAINGGSGVTVITTSQTATVAATLGTSITSNEIENGTITTLDIAPGTIQAADIAIGVIPTDYIDVVSAGTGIAVNEVNGAVTVASTLGTDISSNEIIDGTIQAVDIATGVIPTDFINTVNAGTGVNVATANGEVTISSTLGTNITSNEIVNGTITSNDIANGTIQASDIAAGVIPTDFITEINAATGVNVNTNNGVATISTPLGVDITSNEIVNGTITSNDIANGTIQATDIAAGVIPTDFIDAVNAGVGVDVTTLNGEATVAATLGTSITSNEIVNGTIQAVDIAAGVIPTDFIDAVTAGTGVNVTTLNGEATVEATLGTSITSNEIVNGTIQAVDIAAGVIPTNCIEGVNAGTGVTVTTANGVATVNTTLGTSISSNELDDESVTSADIANGTIQAVDIAAGVIPTNCIEAVTAGTGVAVTTANGEATVSVTNITTTEIADGTIQAADIAAGVIPVCITAINAGPGVNVFTANGEATIETTLGTSISSNELEDESVTSADIANGTIQAVDLATGVIPTDFVTAVNGGVGIDVTTANGEATVSTSFTPLENVVDYTNGSTTGVKFLSGFFTDLTLSNYTIGANNHWTFTVPGTVVSPCVSCTSMINIKYDIGRRSVGILTGPDYSYALTVGGTVRASGFSNSSDRRYKKDINSLKDPLSQIIALEGVSYNFDLDRFPNQNFSEKKHFGFIAQEVEKILPHLVSTDEEGYYSVDYIQVIPLLVESIKEMEEEKVKIEQKMTSMEAMLVNLAAKVEGMEKASKTTADAEAARK